MHDAKTRRRHMTRLAVMAFVLTVLTTIGVSVTEVYAGSGGCFEFDCSADKDCKQHDCDICWSYDKCALIPTE